MAFGIPGSGYIESHLMGGKSLSVFEEVTSVLGLNSGNAPVLLMLGDVKFSLNTVAFTEANRSTEASWASVPQFGRMDALQYTGPGPDTLELPGTLYPKWKGSAQTLDTLRHMQRAGEIYFLIDAHGNVLGLFVITAIQESRSLYKSNGEPRKVTFTLSLRRYVELANQKPPQAQSGHGLFGDVRKFIGKIENKIENELQEVQKLKNSVTGINKNPK